MTTEGIGFPWETLNAIVGGRSAIDVPVLQLRTLEEAESFIECYGFNWHHSNDRQQLEAMRKSALEYIQDVLLQDEPSVSMPLEVVDQTDMRRLLLWASVRPLTERQRWTCALLRVMHTMAHATSTLDERFSRQIRDQILDRFKPHMSRRGGKLYLGHGADSVELAHFEVKESKPLYSVLTKLLHKVENVAADIFDWLGVRFVTRERFDALLVVRYLRAHNIIMFANIKPTRSRNTLIDLEWMRSQMELLEQEALGRDMSAQEQIDALRKAVRDRPYPEPPSRSYNPFSSLAYHSIQFTCRHYVRLPDVIIGPGGVPGEQRFFFPFEVQILDEESFELSRSGLASHDVYKQRQRAAVKRRVLGSLLDKP